MSRVDLGGVGVDDLTLEGAIARVSELVRAGEPAEVLCLNAGKLARLRDDAALAAQLDQAALVLADGVGVVMAARLLGRPVPARLAGVDLFFALLAESARQGWRVYLLGGRPEVVDLAVERARARFPGLVLGGWHHGYDADERAVVDRVARSGSQLLFVAMGSPRQEDFVARWRADLGVPVRMGVGGSIDVLAGAATRAPAWMCRLGLEWAWRLASAPRVRFGPAIVAPARVAARAVVRRRMVPPPAP